MATIKFLLQSKSKNAPIYCRFSNGRAVNLKLKTGLHCDPSKWSKLKGLPIPKDESTKELATKLEKLKIEIKDKFNSENSRGIAIDRFWLQSTIETYFNRRKPDNGEYLLECAQHYIDNLPYKVSEDGKKVGVSKSTISKYENVRKLLVEFEKHDQKRYLTKEVGAEFRANFINFLSNEKMISSNTIGRYIKFVKTFVLDARSRGINVGAEIDHFKGYTLRTPKVILDFDELATIRSQHFTTDRLNIARDWLIIGCYTGQRVSDLLRMNSNMLKKIGGFQFIELTQTKTQKLVQIPIHAEVQAILDKYDGEFPPTFTGNQQSNATQFNGYIKTVCRQSGITELTEGFLRNEESNVYEQGMFEKWKLITSHTCRRSFSSNFYSLEKYPTPLLMNITAHATERQFLEYIGKKPIEYSLKLAEIWAEDAKESRSTQNQTLSKWA